MNTSSNPLIKRLLWNGTSSFKQDIKKLLLGEPVIKNIQKGVVFSDLKSQEDIVWGLFFFSGYLTLAKESNTSGPLCMLKIPNQEVYELYTSMMQRCLTEYLPSSDLSDMLQSLVCGDLELFSELFETLILYAMSFYDVSQRGEEKVYQAFVLALLVDLEKTHEVKSNRESGLGRYDVCLIPRNSKDLGIVIEFKKGKPVLLLKKGGH